MIRLTMMSRIALICWPAVAAVDAVSGVDRDHQVEVRHAEDELAAVAQGEVDVVVGSPVEPPQQAVVQLVQRTHHTEVVDEGIGREVDPEVRDDPFAVPGAAVEEQQAELGQILGADEEAVAAVLVAAGDASKIAR